MNLKKGILFTLGWVFFALGAIGVLTPVLPTTPFMLLAAYCFSKSSDRWHAWLIAQPMIGAIIIDWHEHGTIPMRGKVLATIMIIAGYAFLFWRVELSIVYQVILIALPIGVLTFIWTRPTSATK